MGFDERKSKETLSAKRKCQKLWSEETVRGIM